MSSIDSSLDDCVLANVSVSEKNVLTPTLVKFTHYDLFQCSHTKHWHICVVSLAYLDICLGSAVVTSDDTQSTSSSISDGGPLTMHLTGIGRNSIPSSVAKDAILCSNAMMLLNWLVATAYRSSQPLRHLFHIIINQL